MPQKLELQNKLYFNPLHCSVIFFDKIGLVYNINWWVKILYSKAIFIDIFMLCCIDDLIGKKNFSTQFACCFS